MPAASFKDNMSAYLYIPKGQKLKTAEEAIQTFRRAEPKRKPQVQAAGPILPSASLPPIQAESETMPAPRLRGRPKNVTASQRPRLSTDEKQVRLVMCSDDYQRLSNAAEVADMDLSLFVQVSLKNMIEAQEALVGGRGNKKQPFNGKRLVAHF